MRAEGAGTAGVSRWHGGTNRRLARHGSWRHAREGQTGVADLAWRLGLVVSTAVRPVGVMAVDGQGCGHTRWAPAAGGDTRHGDLEGGDTRHAGLRQQLHGRKASAVGWEDRRIFLGTATRTKMVGGHGAANGGLVRRRSGAGAPVAARGGQGGGTAVMAQAAGFFTGNGEESGGRISCR